MLPVIMLLLCTVLRLVPHPANFTPVGAMGVLAGRTLPFTWALASLFVTLMVGDLAVSLLHGTPVFDAVTPFVYTGFAVQAGCGHLWRKRRGGTVVAAALGAVWFFFITNFGVWAVAGLYPRTGAGLLRCYTQALPFFRGTFAGDLLFSVVLCQAYRFFAAARRASRTWAPIPATALAPW